MENNLTLMKDLDEIQMEEIEMKLDYLAVPKALILTEQSLDSHKIRMLNLEYPVKFGRAAGRAQPTQANGIFTSKVLSRDHAIIWVEDEKFFIKDTKSSNGTFINNDIEVNSSPVEIFTGDVIRFGTDVFETKNIYALNKSVLHKCVIIKVHLYMSNGQKIGLRESKYEDLEDCSDNDLRVLHETILEALQSEYEIRHIIKNLQEIISKQQEDWKDVAKYCVSQMELLSKMGNLEQQLHKIRNARQGSSEDEIEKLCSENYKLQCVFRETLQQHQKSLWFDQGKQLSNAEVVIEKQRNMINSLNEQIQQNEVDIEELTSKLKQSEQIRDDEKLMYSTKIDELSTTLTNFGHTLKENGAGPMEFENMGQNGPQFLEAENGSGEGNLQSALKFKVNNLKLCLNSWLQNNSLKLAPKLLTDYGIEVVENKAAGDSLIVQCPLVQEMQGQVLKDLDLNNLGIASKDEIEWYQSIEELNAVINMCLKCAKDVVLLRSMEKSVTEKILDVEISPPKIHDTFSSTGHTANIISSSGIKLQEDSEQNEIKLGKSVSMPCVFNRKDKSWSNKDREEVESQRIFKPSGTVEILQHKTPTEVKQDESIVAAEEKETAIALPFVKISRVLIQILFLIVICVGVFLFCYAFLNSLKLWP